jgi:enoyl-CoA hydratase/carnithine racemase
MSIPGALSVGDGRSVLVDREGGVVQLVLNRTSKLNCLNFGVVSELRVALGQYQVDDTVRSIVISGAGEHFCAGGDLEEMRLARNDIVAYMDAMLDFFSFVEDCPKLVVAQVDGYCLGGGFELALACDIIIASDRALFGLPEPRFGLVPGFAIQRLPAMVGVTAASHLLFGRRFTPASVAQNLGLTQDIVAPGELAATVRSVTDNVADLDPAAVATAKQAYRTYRRHAANLHHSAWANAALFDRLSAEDALDRLVPHSRPRDEAKPLNTPGKTMRSSRDVI